MTLKESRIIEQESINIGHWIFDETDGSITCSKCGCCIWANDIHNGDAHFCPNCGAEMLEETDYISMTFV